MMLATVAWLLVAVHGAAVPELDPAASWARVLEGYVDERGKVDFQGLAADRTDLDEFVGFVSRVAPWSHPERYPTESGRLAYHINAYNALAMRAILDEGVPVKLGFLRRASFFKGTQHTIGGRRMSLHAYENEVIRDFGDPRIHFAINCMSASCPRLLRQPFDARRLDEQLESAAFEFFNSDRHVRVAPDRARVFFSEILKWFTDDFVSERESGSLVEYANRYRSQPIPESYAVSFIDYDWTVIAGGR
jgi:hypothetical protein